MSQNLHRNPTSPPRNHRAAWMGGALAAMALLGLAFWSFSGDERAPKNDGNTMTGSAPLPGGQR